MINFGDRLIKPKDSCYKKILKLIGEIKSGETKYFNLANMQKIYQQV